MFGGTVDLDYPILNRSKNLNLNVDLKDFPIHVFFKTKNVKQDLKKGAILSAKLNYSGSRANPLLGSGKLTVDNIQISEQDNLIEKPLLAEIKDGRLSFTNVELFQDTSLLKLTGFVDKKDAWNARIQGDWNLENVFPYLEFIEQVSGKLETDIFISGPVLKPVIDGSVILSKGSVSVPLGVTVVGATKVNAKIKFDKDTLILEQFVGKIGDGNVTGTGSTTFLFDKFKRESRFSLQAKDILIEPIEQFSLQMNGDLNYSDLPFQDGKLEGKLILANALYEKDLNLTQVIKNITKALLGSSFVKVKSSKTLGFFNKDLVSFDVDVSAPNSILLETNIIQAQIDANLKLLGTLNQPKLDGTISVLDGAFGFQSSKFDILKAVAKFRKESALIDPLLDIIGETTTSSFTGEDHQVRMSVSGTLSNPIVNFSSDTGLPENEVVSLFGSKAKVDNFYTFKV